MSAMSNTDRLHEAAVINKDRLTAAEKARIDALPSADIDHLIRIADQITPDRASGPIRVQFCF